MADDQVPDRMLVGVPPRRGVTLSAATNQLVAGRISPGWYEYGGCCWMRDQGKQSQYRRGPGEVLPSATIHRTGRHGRPGTRRGSEWSRSPRSQSGRGSSKFAQPTGPRANSSSVSNAGSRRRRGSSRSRSTPMKTSSCRRLRRGQQLPRLDGEVRPCLRPDGEHVRAAGDLAETLAAQHSVPVGERRRSAGPGGTDADER